MSVFETTVAADLTVADYQCIYSDVQDNWLNLSGNSTRSERVFDLAMRIAFAEGYRKGVEASTKEIIENDPEFDSLMLERIELSEFESLIADAGNNSADGEEKNWVQQALDAYHAEKGRGK